MSGSIWFGEIDKTLKTLIPTKVYTLNEALEQVPLPTLIRTPESEFSSEKFPCATISSYGQRFDNFRYQRGKVVTSRDIELGKALIEDTAKPYSMMYQIDFWAKYFEDINLMTLLWSSNFEKFNVLDILDSTGVMRSCDMILQNEVVLDQVRNKNERIFHRSYSYLIKVEIDENIEEEVPIVLSRNTIVTTL